MTEISGSTPDLKATANLRDRLLGATAGLRTNLSRIAATCLLTSAGGLVAFAAQEVASPAAAYADTLGYPWPTDTEAPCQFGAAGGTSCQNTDPLKSWDKYDWGVYVDGVFHPYRDGYEYRNCTDYVQWKEGQEGATVPHGLGNGGQWYDNVPVSERSTTPKAWDAAVVPGNPGHVAFVESVNSVDPNNPGNDNITVSEYNHDTQGHGDTRTGKASDMGFTEYVDFGKHPTSSGGTHSNTVTKLQKNIASDGTQQLYTTTSADVYETWWNSTSNGPHTSDIINIAQNNIVDSSKITAPDGTQELYTAVPTGVWETDWNASHGPASAEILQNLQGVRKVIANTEVINGTTYFNLYVLTNNGPFHYWWQPGGNIQSRQLAQINNPLAIVKGTSPSGQDEIFTATPGGTWETSWTPGNNPTTTTELIGISQNNITAIDKLNGPNGTEILDSATTTGDWETTWGGNVGGPQQNYLVGNFSGALAVKRRIDTDGTNQLYLANGNKVQQYWWNATGSGGATLINISQGNIDTIDQTNNQLYTGAGANGWETWWDGSGIHTGNPPLITVTNYQ